MSSTDRERWNEKHGNAQKGRPASGRLLAALDGDLLRRGRALDVACGRGRHVLALARAGFDVLAVDVSDVGLSRTIQRIEHEGRQVHALRRDLAQEGLPPGEFDLVVVVDYLERSLFPGLRSAVAPGGAIFYETFSVRHAEATGFRREFCLEPGELLAAFAGFEILSHQDEERDGRFQESLLARRPALANPPA